MIVSDLVTVGLYFIFITTIQYIYVYYIIFTISIPGKTSILYKVKLNENICITPTIGFNVEKVSPVKGVTFTVWDISGQSKPRHLWKHYFQNTQGMPLPK